MRSQEVNVSPKFIKAEKVKQNEKAEEWLSIESKRKSLKINETEINRLPDKEFKVLVKKNNWIGEKKKKQKTDVHNEHMNKQIEKVF